MTGERVCFSFELRPGAEEEYDRRHREIWPELVGALRDRGFRSFTMFRNGVRVVGYAECQAGAFAAVGETDADRRWSEWMAPLVAGDFTYYDEVWTLPA